jgi:hypothetical protein
MEMLTAEPSMVKHYNHLAFQSYFVHPRMLETLDKLRFDCYRVGMVTDDIEAMEPVLRNTDMLSRFAGLSNKLSSFGIYGYTPSDDIDELTAKQISQLLWYFIDGRQKLKQEASLDELQHYNEYHTAFAEVETSFLQSKKTQRWWMKMPDKKYIACSYQDYVQASNNEIPERWLRVQERG